MVDILTNRGICYQGILVHYRNAVADHICVTLSAKYPDDWQERVRCRVTQKEWEDARKHAESTRNKALVSEPLKDPEDLLDVRHFHNLFEAHFDDLFPGLGDRPEGARKELRQGILNRAGRIKTDRDSIAHPSRDDMTWWDAVGVLTAAEDILKHINKDAAQEVGYLRQTVVEPDKTTQPTVAEPNKTTQRLPRPYFPKLKKMVKVDFVGREDEKKWLRDWINEPDDDTCRVLVGDGGKGKSAIAYEFARYVSRKRPEGLEIVIWLSAKKAEFQGGAAEDKTPDFWDLDSAVNGILKAYQKEYGPNGYEDMAPAAKSAECLQWLEAYPALIVLDDFDSLEKLGGRGETLRKTRNFFEKDLLRKDTKSRVLLTSRVRISALEDEFEQTVQGFNPEDGEKFIQKVRAQFELPSDWFQPPERAEILRVCDGSPLYIEELLRQCKTLKEDAQGKDEVLKVIETWEKDGGERARRYALEAELKTLSRDAQNALLACALFNEDLLRDQLKVILEFDDEEFDDERLRNALKEMRGLFLIDTYSQGNERRLTMNSNTKELVISVAREGEPDTVKRLNGRLQHLYGGEKQGDSTHRLDVTFYKNQANEASRGGDHDKAISLLKEAIALCEVEQEPDEGLLGDLYGRLALAYNRKGDVRSARRSYKQAAAFRCPVPATYKNWFRMEKGRKQWTAAAEAVVTGLKILRQTGASQEDLAALHLLAAEAREGKARDLAARRNPAAAKERERADEHRRDAASMLNRARRDRLNS